MDHHPQLRPFLLLSSFCLLLLSQSSFARRHRHFQHSTPQLDQQHFSKQTLETMSNDGGDGSRMPQHRRSPKMICVHGSAVAGRCVCDQGWAGTNCHRQMHCANFERTANGSCTSCLPNYSGDRCQHLECQNGGEELGDQSEPSCKCPKPYSGDFCEELLTKNIYSFYNSKVATLGPLGLISVIPMIGAYVLCERFARKRQVRRIEKTWNEQTSAHVNPENIEQLLKEKK